MNGEDLKQFLISINSVSSYFKGIFSINTLPLYLNNPSFVICNYDTDKKPGSHWFCLFRCSQNKVECFDSLGLNSERLKLISDNLKIKYVTHITYNETQVQSKFTSTCGNFVLYFAIQRLHNLDLSFSELLNEIFDSDPIKNENTVKKFLETIKNE